MTALEVMAQQAELDRIYGSFASAETGSFKDKWIRTTHQPKGGSTAFGPVQITMGKALDYATRANQTGLSKESQEFVYNVLAPMQEKMATYGGKDMKPGFEDYDYGGSGKFDVEKYGVAYERLAKEMMLHDYKQSGGDTNTLIKLWRGTSGDKRYNDEFNKSYK